MKWQCECGAPNTAHCRLPARCGECGSPAWFADQAGNHDWHAYASWVCQHCGDTAGLCYACGVIKHNDGQATGKVVCPTCGYEEPYPLT